MEYQQLLLVVGETDKAGISEKPVSHRRSEYRVYHIPTDGRTNAHEKPEREGRREGTNPKLFSDHLLPPPPPPRPPFALKPPPPPPPPRFWFSPSVLFCLVFLSPSLSHHDLFCGFFLPSKPLRSEIHQMHILFFLV